MARKKKAEPASAPKQDATNFTQPRQFRLADDTLAKMDWLAERLGGLSRSDVIRQAVHELALQKGYIRQEGA